jgi:hypothetical protein
MYLNLIDKILKQNCVNIFSCIHDIALAPETLMTQFSSNPKWGQSTAVSYMRNIFTIIRFNPIIHTNDELMVRWRTCIDRLDAGRKIKELNHQVSEAELNKYVSYDDCVTLSKNIPRNHIHTRLLFGMYLLIPPVRNDYWKCYINQNNSLTDEEKNDNWIDVRDDGKVIIHLNKYKTVKVYGPLVTECPDELAKLILESLVADPRKYLFTRGDNGPYRTPLEFSTWANTRLLAVTGKPFSILTFRHIYLSRPEIRSLPPTELCDISKRMGHSMVTQHRYMWDIPSKESETALNTKDV